MGRNVEDAILGVATEEARRLGAGELVAEHLPAEKNGRCWEFWEESDL